MKLKLALIIAAVFCGCATTNISPEFDQIRRDVTQFDLITPSVHLEKFEARNKTIDVEGQLVCRENITSSVKGALGPDYRICALQAADSTSVAVDREIRILMGRLKSSRNFNAVETGMHLNSLMSQGKTDYSIVVQQYGFTRSGGNMVKETIKSLLVAVLTLGTFYFVPVESSSLVYVAIINNRERRVVYFESNSVQNNPTDHEITLRQFMKVFRVFLYGDRA